jgi:hypothetical protein
VVKAFSARDLEHKAFMKTYPWPITKETTHENYDDCIGYRVCAFEHFRTCTSGRRYGWRKLHFGRLRGEWFLAWLVLERQHDRNWRRFNNRSEQHSKPVRKFPGPQRLA